jgi:hypothetical protein
MNAVLRGMVQTAGIESGLTEVRAARNTTAKRGAAASRVNPVSPSCLVRRTACRSAAATAREIVAPTTRGQRLTSAAAACWATRATKRWFQRDHRRKRASERRLLGGDDRDSARRGRPQVRVLQTTKYWQTEETVPKSIIDDQRDAGHAKRRIPRFDESPNGPALHRRGPLTRQNTRRDSRLKRGSERGRA